MNGLYAILGCSLCLNLLVNASYLRIPKRFLLQNQEKQKSYLRKIPFIKTIPGGIPILPVPYDAQILSDTQSPSETLPVTSLNSNNAQYSPETSTAIFINRPLDNNAVNAQSLAEVLPSPVSFNRLEAQSPSETITLPNRPEQLLPQKFTANYFPLNKASIIQSNPANLPQNQLTVKQILPITQFSQPIVKYNLPEMKTLPIFTLLPILTLPKVNLLPQSNVSKEKLPIEDPLIAAIGNDEMQSQENVLVNMNVTQEVKYEIVSQKAVFQSQILHKLQKVEETKSNIKSLEKEDTLKTNDQFNMADALRDIDFVSYYKSLQEKAEGYILKPQNNNMFKSPQKVLTNSL